MSRTPLLAGALALSICGPALGQADVKVSKPEGERVPAWVAAQIADPDDPRVKEYAARQKVRVQLERELGKLRADYFRARRTDIRQAGILKLRQYKDPVVYPSLLKIFEREGDDVRLAILDHLADLRNDEADTTLAWAAVFDHDPKIREGAGQRLLGRVRLAGDASGRVKTVIAEGLRTGSNEEITSAAKLIHTLKLVEAIPMLISAQAGGQTIGSGGGDDSNRSLAWIMVATQEAFVADLTPVVGDNAVAFDPTIGVVTDGVVLRVIDAVVITYRVEVHNELVGLSSEAWGRPTADLGWNNDAWRAWYKDEFKPFLAAKQARERELAAEAGTQAAKPAPGR